MGATTVPGDSMQITDPDYAEVRAVLQWCRRNRRDPDIQLSEILARSLGATDAEAAATLLELIDDASHT